MGVLYLFRNDYVGCCKYLMMKNFFVIGFSFLFSAMSAQEVRDLSWDKNIADREFLPYQKVREADVFWSKRLWRIIDLREKRNIIFRYPDLTLAEILHKAVLEGKIHAYDNTVANGDQFKLELNMDEISKIGVTDEEIEIMDAETFEYYTKSVHQEFDFSSVTKFKIKEDWFFNSATSTMEVRIIGLAPMKAVFDDNGNYLGDETLYWLYYPDLRPILAKVEAYNTGNFAVRLSWDDIFEARYFASYIYKEDNVYDRNIQEYATGMDALFESEKIKEKIFNFEHDLWSY